MRYVLISLGVASLVAALVWLTIVVFAPSMNAEKAGNVIVFAFIGAALVTWLLSKRKRG